MYNTPRAATITATTKGTLWSLVSYALLSKIPFWTDAFSPLSSELEFLPPQFDWSRAPSSKHQFESMTKLSRVKKLILGSSNVQTDNCESKRNKTKAIWRIFSKCRHFGKSYSKLYLHQCTWSCMSHTDDFLRILNVVKLQMLWSRKNTKKMTSLLNR